MTTQVSLVGESGLVVQLGVEWPSGASVVEKFDQERKKRVAATTIQVVFRSTTNYADLRAEINAVESLLDDVTDGRQKVWLHLRLEDETTPWRSQIYAGELRAADTLLGLWQENVGARGTIALTHVPYFEGDEVELQLSSVANASPATGGVTIHNCKDSTPRGNYVQIASSQVGGVVPAPVRLELTNNSGASQDYRHFYLAVNALSDPAAFSYVLEGESAVGAVGTVAANNSGGQVLQFSTSTATEHEWTLSAAVMEMAAGRPFRILARFDSYTTTEDIFMQPKLQDVNGLIDLAWGDEVLLPAAGNQLVDLGVLHLGSRPDYSAWADHRLAIATRVSGAVTVRLDCLFLMALDAYQYIEQLGYTVANNGVITVDGSLGNVHCGGVAIYSVRGGPLLVFPGLTQRIYIVHDEGTSAPIANTFSVRAYHRPRRLLV